MDRGTYIEYDGRPAVRFQHIYSHPIERVWAAVTQPDELSHWFPFAVQIEPKAGGRIEFSGDPNMEPMTGTIMVFDPPSRFSFKLLRGDVADGPHSDTGEPWREHYDAYIADGMPHGADIPGAKTPSDQ
jgi:uncharacterized protein YndB with AHSA1/START domain